MINMITMLQKVFEVLVKYVELEVQVLLTWKYYIPTFVFQFYMATKLK